MPENTFFTIGGNIRVSNDVLYIERQADAALLSSCEAGEFSYVLTSRQMGKSSLMVHVAEQLRQQGTIAIVFELAEIGTNVTSEQWYRGLLNLILRRANVKFDIRSWWRENKDISLTERFINFLEYVLLKEIDEKIVIFLDEIDTTITLDFTDDFYAAIRAIHNLRATNENFRRLSFVLIGSGTPSDLISDPTRTPFNIGNEIVLADFTMDEALPFTKGFDVDEEQAKQLLGLILNWSSGHPYLTQKLCAAVATSDVKIESSKDIDDLVNKTFFSQTVEQDNNIQYVRVMLTDGAPPEHHGEIIGLLQLIQTGHYIPDDKASVVQSHLKLSGIVRVSNRGGLIIRNKIYRNIFDARWMRETIEKYDLDVNPHVAQKAVVTVNWDLSDNFAYVIADEDTYNSASDIIDYLTENGVRIWYKSQQEDADLNLLQATIQSATTTIYLASPTALDAMDVQREIDLAQFAGKPLIIGWVAGDTQTDAIPLSLINDQYFDLRMGRQTGRQEFLETIRDVGMFIPEPPGDRHNPYKGLESFGLSDAEDFFGRTELIEQLKADLNDRLQYYEPRFLAVIGASGSGKSSVIKAGLIPALRRGELPASGLWTYIPPFVPGDSPYCSLAEALSIALNRDANYILDTIQASDNSGLIRLLTMKITAPHSFSLTSLKKYLHSLKLKKNVKALLIH